MDNRLVSVIFMDSIPNRDRCCICGGATFLFLSLVGLDNLSKEAANSGSCGYIKLNSMFSALYASVGYKIGERFYVYVALLLMFVNIVT